MVRRSAGSARRTQGILGGRSEQVVRRVLDAALLELASSGYAGFRIEAVASRAAVNKTTIYRRWPRRVALVGAVVDRMRTPLREQPLPDTGRLERDLIEAFARRFAVSRKVDGRAWARLLDERYNAEVDAIIGATVDERRQAWRSMIERAIERRELPRGTDASLFLELVRAIVDARSSSQRMDRSWLGIAVRTVMAGACAGTLARRRNKPAVTTRVRRSPRRANQVCSADFTQRRSASLKPSSKK